MYLLVSEGGSAARAAGSAAKKIAPHKMTAHRRGQRFPSDPILIRSLGWSVPPVARAVARARVRISYTGLGNRSQRIVKELFPISLTCGG